jgi:multidrug resistance efflux pump
MRSISIALFVTFCAIASSQGQGTAGTHDAAVSPALARIKALQNQINKQQIEINALKTSIAKLQDTYQELADTIADESTDAEEDDFSNDSGVTGFVVNSPSARTKRDAGQIRRSAIAICGNRTLSRHKCCASLKESTIQ